MWKDCSLMSVKIYPHLDLNGIKLVKTWSAQKKRKERNKRTYFPLSFPSRLSEIDFLKFDVYKEKNGK